MSSVFSKFVSKLFWSQRWSIKRKKFIFFLFFGHMLFWLPKCDSAGGFIFHTNGEGTREFLPLGVKSGSTQGLKNQSNFGPLCRSFGVSTGVFPRLSFNFSLVVDKKSKFYLKFSSQAVFSTRLAFISSQNLKFFRVVIKIPVWTDCYLALENGGSLSVCSYRVLD